MSKSTRKFERKAKDFYPTPREPIEKLVPHLDVQHFIEPMCGDGSLINALYELGVICVYASDIEPRPPASDRLGAVKKPIEELTAEEVDPLKAGTPIITNPPWPSPGKRGEPTIGHIRKMLELSPNVWVLLDADILHSGYIVPLLPHLRKAVSVGRISWLGNGVSSKSNSIWCNFTPDDHGTTLEFVPNVPKRAVATGKPNQPNIEGIRSVF